jgi:hypothetical protein
MLYWAANAAMPTTAPIAGVATGTSTKTLLQIAPPSTQPTTRVVAFGIEFATVLTAACTVELIETNVAATVTAHVAAGVMPYGGDAIGGTSSMTLGTSATGYTASAEGSITTVRYGKIKVIPSGAAEYEWEWSLGREFAIAGGKFARIRVTTATTVNATCWMLWDE